MNGYQDAPILRSRNDLKNCSENESEEIFGKNFREFQSLVPIHFVLDEPTTGKRMQPLENGMYSAENSKAYF